MYADGHSVIDDRRWVDVSGHEMVLEHVDPGASLASLVIEPVGAVTIGACERDRVPHALAGEQREARGTRKQRDVPADAFYVPVVRCTVTGAPGKYLVRVLYVSAQLGYRAEHEVTMPESTHVAIASRYSIATPPWGGKATVALFDGVPGSDQPPVEIARGPVTLDGAIAVIAPPARERRASLRRVLRNDTPDSIGPAPVWLWLELPGLRLPPGAVHVHLGLPDEDIRDGDLGPNARAQTDDGLRLRLWSDDSLRGSRQMTTDYSERAEFAERISISVLNIGKVAREVWVEDPLRPASHRRIERAIPTQIARVRDHAVVQVTVAPGKVEHVAFTAAYDY